jgi:hypothetical protein
MPDESRHTEPATDMKLTAKVLDTRKDGESQCLLCRITLESYVKGLPTTYQDYEVQREIVSNVYLDHLVDTVLRKQHIPPIVLVVESGNFALQNGDLEIRDFKILDGLQRTFRLQAIWETVQYGLEKVADWENYLGWNKFKFSRQFSADMRALNSNTDTLRSVLEGLKVLGKPGLVSSFSENGQWFEVWIGLSPDEEVKKMLTLNAGHKSVKTRHQLELLFLNLLPTLRAGEGRDFRLVREKEVSSTQFSKKRETGSFHFAHIISALLSFYSGKPITPSVELIQGIQTSEAGIEEYDALMSPEFLREFVAFLVKLDRLLSDQYQDLGVLWMGREVTLAGLFGALGTAADNSDVGRQDIMRRFLEVIRTYPTALNLEKFETVRNSLDLSKVNIGAVNRAAVFSAVTSLLRNVPPAPIDWREHFGLEGG